jgi:hypothetical protein
MRRGKEGHEERRRPKINTGTLKRIEMKYLRFRAAAAIVVAERHLVECARHPRTEAPKIAHFAREVRRIMRTGAACARSSRRWRWIEGRSAAN